MNSTTQPILRLAALSLVWVACRPEMYAQRLGNTRIHALRASASPGRQWRRWGQRGRRSQMRSPQPVAHGADKANKPMSLHIGCIGETKAPNSNRLLQRGRNRLPRWVCPNAKVATNKHHFRRRVPPAPQPTSCRTLPRDGGVPRRRGKTEGLTRTMCELGFRPIVSTQAVCIAESSMPLKLGTRGGTSTRTTHGST